MAFNCPGIRLAARQIRQRTGSSAADPLVAPDLHVPENIGRGGRRHHADRRSDKPTPRSPARPAEFPQSVIAAPRASFVTTGGFSRPICARWIAQRAMQHQKATPVQGQKMSLVSPNIISASTAAMPSAESMSTTRRRRTPITACKDRTYQVAIEDRHRRQKVETDGRGRDRDPPDKLCPPAEGSPAPSTRQWEIAPPRLQLPIWQ